MVSYEIIKSNLNKLLSWKLLIFYVVYIFLGFINKVNFQRRGLNAYEFMTQVFCNQFYVVYFVFPVFLLLVIPLIVELNEIVMIRVKSITRYFTSKVATYLCFSTIFTVGLVFILTIMGLGFKFINQYGITLEQEALFIGPQLMDYFKTPLSLLAFSVVKLILGLTCIMTLLDYVYMVLKSKKLILMVLVISLVFTALSVSGKGLSYSALLQFNTYLTVSADLTKEFGLFIIEWGIMLAMVLSIRRLWQFQKDGSLFQVNIFMRKVLNGRTIGLMTAILCVTTLALSLLFRIDNVVDFISLQFIGIDDLDANITLVIGYLVKVLFPLVLTMYFLQSQIQNDSCFIKIRYNTRARYYLQVLITLLSINIVYTLVMGTVTLCGGLFMMLKSDRPTSVIYIFNPLNTLFIGMVIKALEMFLIQLIGFLIVAWNKRIALAFFLPIGLYLLSFFHIQIYPLSSVSIERWGIVNLSDLSVLTIILGLLLINSVISLVIYKKGKL